VSGILLFACISRDNYWDPLNFTAIFQRNVRDSALARIDSGFTMLAIDSLDSIEAGLSAIAALNKKLHDSNDLRKTQNDTIFAYNDTVQKANDTLQSTTTFFKLKLRLDTLFLLVLSDTFPILQHLDSAVSLERQRADTIITNTNTRASPVVIFSFAQYSSILSRYDAILARIDTLGARITTLQASATGMNADSITPYNDWVKMYNMEVVRYNDTVTLRFGTKVIPNSSDSIVIYLLNAVAGSKFLLANGSFDLKATIRFNNSGTAKQPILVQGQDSTVINMSDVVLDAPNSHIIFNNIQFAASSMQCVLVQNGCTGIVFNRCVFDGNAKRGITIANSDVTLNDCIIKNGAEAIAITSLPEQSRTVTLNNVVIMNETDYGITVSGTNLIIQNASILRNGGEAIFLASPALNLVVNNTIIANNGGANPAPAIYFEGGFTGAYQFTMTNVNMVYNGANQDTVNAPVTGPILHYDPMFINEYEISPSSVLDSLEKAGTVIGYRRK
jgi:hypothetical protein